MAVTCHVVGRVGCFLAGCCYGRPTDLPWGVVFTNPLAAENVGTGQVHSGDCGVRDLTLKEGGAGGHALHAGHVALLPDGCRHGDRLIVGVLSDAWAAAPSLSMGIASSCMTAPPRLKIACDKDTKGAGGRSHPQRSRPGQHGLWDQGGTDFREPPRATCITDDGRAILHE